MAGPAGAPPRVTDASPAPTSHAPPFILDDELTFDEEGNLVIEGEVIPPDRALAVSEHYEICFVEGAWYVTRRDNGKGGAVRLDAARGVYDFWPHEPTIPALTPAVEVRKRDLTGLTRAYQQVNLTLRITADLGRWRVDAFGAVETDDGRFYPPDYIFRVEREDGIYGRDEAFYLYFLPRSGEMPTVYYQDYATGPLHQVMLTPEVPPSIFDKLREDPLRQQIAVAIGLVCLFALAVNWVVGEPVLAIVLAAGPLALWWLYWHPKARPMPVNYFEQQPVGPTR
jgi:hypothetical protein